MVKNSCCNVCLKIVRKNAKVAICNICNCKVHKDCSHLSNKKLNALNDMENTETFYCSYCINDLLPFGNESNQIFAQTNILGLNKDSNLENLSFKID